MSSDMPAVTDREAAFGSATASAIKSVRQKWLVKRWEDLRGAQALPLRGCLSDEDFDDDRADFSVFDLVADEDGIRFRLASHGPAIAKAYGSQCAGRYLDEIVPADMRAHQLEPYRQAVARLRPVYVTAATRDSRGRAVRFERLLMPFSDDGCSPACVVADFEMISIDGAYDSADLLAAKDSVPIRRKACIIVASGRG